VRREEQARDRDESARLLEDSVRAREELAAQTGAARDAARAVQAAAVDRDVEQARQIRLGLARAAAQADELRRKANPPEGYYAGTVPTPGSSLSRLVPAGEAGAALAGGAIARAAGRAGAVVGGGAVRMLEAEELAAIRLAALRAGADPEAVARAFAIRGAAVQRAAIAVHPVGGTPAGALFRGEATPGAIGLMEEGAVLRDADRLASLAADAALLRAEAAPLAERAVAEAVRKLAAARAAPAVRPEITLVHPAFALRGVRAVLAGAAATAAGALAYFSRGSSGLKEPRPQERPPGERPLLRIDPSTAGPRVIGALPGVGPALSRAIVEARERAAFKSAEDFDKRVPGVGKATLRGMRDFLRFPGDPPDLPDTRGADRAWSDVLAGRAPRLIGPPGAVPGLSSRDVPLAPAGPPATLDEMRKAISDHFRRAIAPEVGVGPSSSLGRGIGPPLSVVGELGVPVDSVRRSDGGAGGRLVEDLAAAVEDVRAAARDLRQGAAPGSLLGRRLVGSVAVGSEGWGVPAALPGPRAIMPPGGRL